MLFNDNKKKEAYFTNLHKHNQSKVYKSFNKIIQNYIQNSFLKNLSILPLHCKIKDSCSSSIIEENMNYLKEIIR